MSVVKQFIDVFREEAVGQAVLKSVTPGQMVVKIVHDQLIKMLGPEDAKINLNASPPVPIMLVGLQGAGKTTTAGKLASHLRNKENKRVLLAGLDVARPAAQEQLLVLGEEVGVDSLQPVFGEQPVGIAKRAMETAKREGFDAVILDTAGRLAIDHELMMEVALVRDTVEPAETLLVADALSGQDAVATAQAFNDKVGITGIVSHGSMKLPRRTPMRAATGCPIGLGLAKNSMHLRSRIVSQVVFWVGGGRAG